MVFIMSNNILLEDRRSALLSQSKSGADYAPQNRMYGANRYKRRLRSSIAPSIKHFNNMDMDKFFKTDTLDVSVDINGETNIYKVRMSFVGTLDELHKEINKNNVEKVDRKMILKALMKAFNRDDVYINCSCPDFCLHPTTQIKLMNGDVDSIENLFSRFSKGEEMWVYSTDEKGDFKPGKVEDIWISNYTNEFVQVTLDNNEEIITTPTHRFMLRDGSYAEAKDLKENQSLMPLYFSYHDGYENVKINSEPYPSKFKSVYKEVANTLLLDEIEEAKIRSGEDDIAIHHSDYNKLNNYPSNLKPMGVLEHWNWHSNHVKETGQMEKWLEAGREYWSSQEARDKQALVMSEVMTNYYANRTPEEIKRDSESRSKVSKEAWKRGCFDTEKWHKAAKERGIQMHTPEREALTLEGIHRYWENISEEEREKRAAITRENQKKSIESIKGKPFTEEHKKKISESHKNRTEEEKLQHSLKIRDTKIIKVFNKILADGGLITFDSYEAYRPGGYPNIRKHFSTIDDAIAYYSLDDRYNHKVAKVEFITFDEDIPVYDVQVKDYNNFYVNAGVILHNCYRFKYWATRKGLLIGDPENRPADITNPGDNKGPGCKHIILCLSDSSWLIKIASVIFNYINYMEEHDERLYQRYIYPAVYDKEYENRQLSIFDDEEEFLDSDEETIETSNKEARERGRFKKGNEYRFRKNQDENQMTFDDLENEFEEESDEDLE